MDRLSILSEELKKYFVLAGERPKRRSSIWKCKIEKCEKTMEIGKRMDHLKFNHKTIFEEIDKKLLIKDITKNRLLSSLNVVCNMCGEKFKSNNEFSKHRRLYNLNIFVYYYFSFKANYGGVLGCPLRDDFFSGPYRTWKRWNELYNKRKNNPSTKEEREDRLKNVGKI